jgi:hypothetical protein
MNIKKFILIENNYQTKIHYYNNIVFFKLLFFIPLILIKLIIKEIPFKFAKKQKIGVVGLGHSQNIGNNLLKYSIFIILEKYGFDPYIIGRHLKQTNISFLESYTNVRIIKDFSEIKERDYDILMVNSDQTWRKWNKDFYNIAFLKFSEKWNISKFIYGTSIGFNDWKFTKKDENIAKYLLKNFTGISVREENLVKLIKKHLDMKAIFVLDPTLLIDKKYYLRIIKNYKLNINGNENYIFTYTIWHHEIKKMMEEFINEAKEKLNYPIYNVDMHGIEYIEKFLYGISNCKAVITDSFHGTVFSILFNKPFISFRRKKDERLKTLGDVLGIKERIIDLDKKPDVTLLNIDLYINKEKLNKLKFRSIRYLKKNLNIDR